MKDFIFSTLFVILLIEVVGMFDKIRSYIDNWFRLTSLQDTIKQQLREQEQYLNTSVPEIVREVEQLEAQIKLLKQENEKGMLESQRKVENAENIVKETLLMSESLRYKIQLLSKIAAEPETSKEQIQEYLNCLQEDIEAEKIRQRLAQEQAEQRRKQARAYLHEPKEPLL